MTDLLIPPAVDPLPGQILARGVCRFLSDAMDFACLEEFVPERGKRVDVMAIGPKGEIWVIECKSCRADFMSDAKWDGYLPWCDRFFWTVDTDFPLDLLPEGTGVIIADGYGADLLREAPETPLAPARRKVITRSFARTAARRLQGMRDPRL